MSQPSRTHRSPRFAPVARIAAQSNGTPSQPEDATAGQYGPRGASANVALSRKLRRKCRAPSGWVLPEK